MKKITNKNQFNTLADLQTFLKKYYKSFMKCKGKTISDILFYGNCTVCLKFTDGCFSEFYTGDSSSLSENVWGDDDGYIDDHLLIYLQKMNIIDNKTLIKLVKEREIESVKYRKQTILRRLNNLEIKYKTEKAELEKLLL